MEWKQNLEYYDITTILFSWSTCIRLSKEQFSLWISQEAMKSIGYIFSCTILHQVQLYPQHLTLDSQLQTSKCPNSYICFINTPRPVPENLHNTCSWQLFPSNIYVEFLQTYAINIKHGFINSITKIIFHDRYFIPVHQIFPFTTFNSYHKMRGRGEILHIVTFASNNISDNLIETLAFRNYTHIRISDNFHITSALKRNQPFRNSFH